MAKADMDAVLNESINSAVRFLQEYGEFFPFAVAKVAKGDIRHVQTWGPDERPAANDVIILLYSGLREAASKGAYCTTAVVSNVRLRESDSSVSTDAVRIHLEDTDAPPVDCYVPLCVKGTTITVGEIKAEPGKSLVFGPSSARSLSPGSTNGEKEKTGT